MINRFPLCFSITLVACGSSSHSPRAEGVTDAGHSLDGAASPDDASPSTDSSTHAVDSSTAPVDSGVKIDGSVVSTVDGGGQWVMGYYVGYSINEYPIASIDWTGLTHIIFAPLTVNDDLSLNLSFSDETGADAGPGDALTLARAAHANGVKALFMLGGQGYGQNIATAAEPANLAAFVTALTSALTTYGYDGIDMDWEDYVNDTEFVALAQALRAANPGMILSVPGAALNANFPTVPAWTVTLAESLDRYNVQTYYPSNGDMIGQGWDSWLVSPLGGATGSTPAAIDNTLALYADAGIPKNKLGMGTAFYAMCYSAGITGPNQATTSGSISGGDNTYPLADFYAAGSTYDTSTVGEQMLDTAASEPYLSFASPITDPHCGSTQFISYENETSIEAKGAFSKANGYGGIIIWTINEGWLPTGASGGRAQNSLMQALRTGFISP